MIDRVRLLALAGGSVTAGAAVTVAALFLAGWRYVPVHRYDVAVQMEAGATAERTAAVRDVLAKLPSERGVLLDDRQQRFAEFAKKAEADGVSLPDGLSATDMPERLLVTVSGRDFDCSAVSMLHDQPGVGSLSVSRTHGGTGQVAALGCR